MQIKRRSYFKSPESDFGLFDKWVKELERENGYQYEENILDTSLGKTVVYSLNADKTDRESLVIFPGYRTTSLIWDLDKGLNQLAHSYRIFMIETNGQPNKSDGNTPDIKSLDYGHWANEVIEQLGIQQTYITGASFGGLITMKFAITNPEKVKAAFLLNPGCFRYVSFAPNNMYYNILPILATSRKNISKFLDKIVFSKPNHALSEEAEKLLIDYQYHAIKQYKDNTQKPYNMGSQLEKVKVPVYLLVGKKDILLPYQKSVANAKKRLGSNLKEVKIFENVGHGIEVYSKAIEYIEDLMGRIELRS